MSKENGLLLLGALCQTGAMLGFVLLSDSSIVFVKTAWLLLVAISLLWIFLKVAKRQKWSEALGFIVALAVLAVCTQQLLGFLVYPGLMKDIVPMTNEHARLTLIVFAVVVLIYLGGYGLIWGALYLLRRYQHAMTRRTPAPPPART